MKNQKEEYLDLVNKDDVVIGNKKRSEIKKEKLKNYRVVILFIKNSKGQIWIPRRTKNKELFPLSLDMSMGGHVESGESYEEALKRETLEELNINLDGEEVEMLGYLNPNKDDVSSFMRIYEIKMEKTPNFNKEEFIKYYWLKPKEIIEKIKKGDKAKTDLIKLIKLFYT